MKTSTNSAPTHAQAWPEHPYFAALDWASDHHDVAVVDRHGQIALEFRFAHTASGWAEFVEQMRPYAGAPLALETSSGPAVDQLLQRGWTLYPVNPKAAQRYRERKLPSGTKTDRHDAWSLAEALRTDGYAWRPLHPQDEATTTLRALCRDEMALIEQRTVFINQLRAALAEYYPTALEAFTDWTSPGSWAFVERFPTPEALLKAGRRHWEKFLHTHRLWRGESGPERLALFAAAHQLPASPAIVSAKSLLATTMATMLRTLEKQLHAYRQSILQVFEQHPDHEIFGSLPGAGEKIGPRLLAELGADRAVFPDAQSLQCHAGVSPVSFQSGQINKAKMRWACVKTLRATVHLWADLSRHQCPWAQACYAGKRAEGKSHAEALRCLGKRWLKILWCLWQGRQIYQEEVYLQSLQAHGSWVHARLHPTT